MVPKSSNDNASNSCVCTWQDSMIIGSVSINCVNQEPHKVRYESWLA